MAEVRDGRMAKDERYDPRRAWLTTIAACMLMLAGCSSLNVLTPILPMMLSDLDATTNFGSALNFVDTTTSAILAIPVGFALNHWGYRKVGCAGFLLLLISFAWGSMPFAHDMVQLLIIRALQGAAYAIPPILCIAIVPEWFPDDKQSIPLAIVSCMANVAKVVMLQMSKITVPLGGWHGQFAGAFVFTLICFILFMGCLKNKPISRTDAIAIRRGRPRLSIEAIRCVLSNRSVWLIIVIMCGFTLGRRSFDPFSNMIWMDNCGISADHASDIDSVFFFMNIPSALLFGYILSLRKHRGTIAACMLSVYFIGMSCAFFLSQAWEASVFVVCVGLLGSVPTFCQTALPLIVRDRSKLTMTLAVFDLIGKYIVGSIAPFTVSLIQTATGSWMYCSIPIMIIGVIALACCWRVAPVLNKHDPSLSR